MVDVNAINIKAFLKSVVFFGGEFTNTVVSVF
jgi:hypothetical protein